MKVKRFAVIVLDGVGAGEINCSNIGAIGLGHIVVIEVGNLALGSWVVADVVKRGCKNTLS